MGNRMSSQTSKRSAQSSLSKDSTNLMARFTKKNIISQNRFQTFQNPIPENITVKKWISQRRGLPKVENTNQTENKNPVN